MSHPFVSTPPHSERNQIGQAGDFIEMDEEEVVIEYMSENEDDMDDDGDVDNMNGDRDEDDMNDDGDKEEAIIDTTAIGDPVVLAALRNDYATPVEHDEDKELKR
jgi:hypothetical protein